MDFIKSIGAVLVAGCLVGNANSQVTTYNSQSAFTTAVPGALSYSFSGFPSPNISLTSPYTSGPLSFSSTSGLVGYNDTLFGSGVNYLASTSTISVGLNSKAVGFTIGTFNNAASVNVLVNGSSAGSVSTTGGHPSTSFIGFSSSSSISSIQFLASGVPEFDFIGFYIQTGPSTADTQQSLVNTAQVLQGTYTLQNSVLANSFSYDCNVFGESDVCVSAGGRNTQVSAASGLNNTSALLIAAYRLHPNYRIGAYADQNLSVSNPGGTVNLGNNTPLVGLFGAWNERLDGTGAEVKVSAAYGQKNTTITRQVVGTSEAGSGSSQLNSQGAQVTAKYGFGVIEDVIVSPYIGMRYTQNNMGGYTEGSSSSVTAPLTYSALNTNATTALAGVAASYKVIPAVTTFASVGVETDTNTANGSYYGTNSNITGLTPVNFNSNPVKTRPTATLGAYYDIEKNQRLGIAGMYRQEAYQAVQTTTVMATYTIGL